jgi:hypothetical protein
MQAEDEEEGGGGEGRGAIKPVLSVGSVGSERKEVEAGAPLLLRPLGGKAFMRTVLMTWRRVREESKPRRNGAKTG